MVLWNVNPLFPQLYVGGNADIMVSPIHLKKVETQFILKNLKYSVMVENAGDLIRLEQVKG